ncbi:hypothetical protein OD917_21475 [Flavobacterium sp. SH_e]|uniref:hypothetical protein n=1 Tax=Flavobacterium sp. SH_e TaxID=2983767 RepID=UPI0021E41EF3|nr:hypothetical protein [Flavobacterium sp. SH_e]MCV2487520.1 hypothetical protein [Flavobacterium sp. SH_e]
MKIKRFFAITILALFFGVLFSPKVFSQGEEKKMSLYNLYYLSKYITADLEQPQANQVYNSIIESIGIEKANATLQNYLKLGKEEKNMDFVGAFLHKRDVKRQTLELAVSTDLYSGNFSSYNEKLQKDYNTYQKKHNEIEKKILPLNNLINDLKENINNYIKLSENDKEMLTIHADSIERAKLETLLKDSINALIKEDSITKETYSQKVKDFTDQYVEHHFSSTGRNSSDNTKNNESEEIKYYPTQIEINSIIQSAEQRAATNSFNLPSESDLINAMAIFLAKRAQQEAVIWFMDQLRENMNNPLIFEAFPETIKLIESLEDFKTPNFSIAWRYAISSDFIKMPKNLASSTWVKNLIFNNSQEKAMIFASCVNFSYELNRLVSEKYNYRDIIRYLYTNPEFDYNNIIGDFEKNNEIQKSLNRSISLLYILTNEFFSIDEKNFRLISYEEINALSQNQWVTLNQLIKIKYGSKFDEDTVFFQREYIITQKENLSKWLGNLLISLSQFDKVNKDYQKALENKNDISSYNFYNVWQITSQIIDNLDYNTKYPSFSKTNLNNQTNKFDITIIKDCVDLYDHMQNKNYSTGIKKLTSIIEKISIYKNNYVSKDFYIQNMQIGLKKDTLFLISKDATNKIIFNVSQNNLEIIPLDNPSKKFTIKDYLKIQPFIGFVKGLNHDYNYNIIKKIDSNFEQHLTEFSTYLNLDKTSKIAFLKILSFYDGKNFDQKKLSDFSKSSQNIDQQIKTANSDIEEARKKYQDQLLKLTSFFSDILSAKNEQDLANVIDSHALPPTSYKLKRRVRHSIDLNGYVGAQLSQIYPNGNTSSLEKQFTAGITAPIGFAFTWSERGPNPDNFGFTIDVVDLGNIVNHYLVSSTVEYPKDVHFSEVFSPSISGMYSFRKTPFVAFFSVKFLPLKSSTITTTIEGQKTEYLVNNKTFDAAVFSLGVKIDIPLVNLFTRLK